MDGQGGALAAKLAERRKGMFDDAEDAAELDAKQNLVAKIDKWLSGIGIGGDEMRGFDPTDIVQVNLSPATNGIHILYDQTRSGD
jgi:hypothetical protein